VGRRGMNLQTPTTNELSDTIVAQIEGKLAQTVPLLPKAFVRVLGKALGAVMILLWKYAGWSLLQTFVKYASTKETVINGVKVIPLVEWGRLIGVGDPLAATRAEHLVEVAVKLQTGTLPAASQLLYAPSGVVHTTVASQALNAATIQVTVRASSDQAGNGGVGSIGNLQPGDVITFANPLSQVGNKATVLSRTIDGADAEDWEVYRGRIIQRFQNKPQGGSFADYIAWARELEGIVNVYPYTGQPGRVNVYIEASPASSGSADGIPTSGQLSEALALINFDQQGLAARRQANALALTHGITRKSFDVVVTGLVAADQAAAEDAIEQAIDQYLRAREPYIVGVTSLPRRDRVTQAAVAGVVDDTVSALGGTFATVTLEVSGAPISAYTLLAGEKAKLGTTTFP
jgi:uncharacterized phage protein gp47/JayE